MNFEEAIIYAQGLSEEKAPFNFNFPLKLKEEFKALCKKKNVLMSELILGLIINVIDYDKGYKRGSHVLELIKKLESCEKSYNDFLIKYNESGDDLIQCEDGTEFTILGKLKDYELKINAIKHELKLRGVKK